MYSYLLLYNVNSNIECADAWKLFLIFMECVLTFLYFLYNQGEECQECPDELLSDFDPLLGRMEKEYIDTGKQVVAGICAMAKKSNSKPMREILARLDEFDYIKTIIFPEETILKVIIDLFFCKLTLSYLS